MTESNPQSDQNATPDDVATLYSWANLHGAKYRDFSASRAQTREVARLRAEHAAHETERHRVPESATAPAAEAERPAAEVRLREEQAQEERAPEERALEVRALEERAPEERVQEERAQEERAQDQKAQEERLAEQQAAEMKAAEQRAQEQQAQEERAQEQRAQEQRVADEWAADQRAEARRAEERRAEEARIEEQRAAEIQQAELDAAAELARRAEWEQQQELERVVALAAEEAAHRRAQQEAQEAAEHTARLEAEQAAAKAEQEAAGQAAELVRQLAAKEAAEHAAQVAAKQAEEQADRLAAKQAAEQAAKEIAERAAILEAEEAAAKAAAETRRQDSLQAAQQAAQLAAERAAEQAAQQLAQQRAWQRSVGDLPAVPPMPFAPRQPQVQDYASLARAQVSRPSMDERPAPAGQTAATPLRSESAQPDQGQNQREQSQQETNQQGRNQQAQNQQGQAGQAIFGPGREERVRPENSVSRNPWASVEAREPSGRPAWLDTEGKEAEPASTPRASAPHAAAAPPPAPQTPALPFAPSDDTLQGSRDRMTSRWFALRGVFDGNVAPIEPILQRSTTRPPAMAVFSLAGGVGKTSLVATLGRALSARGERVLLVDTAAFGLLPFFFGATDQRPGVLRTFNPPGLSPDAPVQMVTLDPEGVSSETPGQESLSGEISNFARGAGRVIVDLATASGATTRRIMRMAPLVLVPVIPDMNSVVSVSSIDAFFEHNSGESNGSQSARPSLPYYVLNQFDASLPLHLDVREVLHEQLGERLLPFALRRAPSMSEALAEGMTVLDYAPGSPLAEDFNTLAGWVKSLSAPAVATSRGVRWSEK